VYEAQSPSRIAFAKRGSRAYATAVGFGCPREIPIVVKSGDNSLDLSETTFKVEGSR